MMIVHDRDPNSVIHMNMKYSPTAFAEDAHTRCQMIDGCRTTNEMNSQSSPDQTKPKAR